MVEPDSRVPRSYATRPPREAFSDAPPVREQTPREQRLAQYMSASPAGGLMPSGDPAGPRRLLVVAAVLAGVPSCLVLGATLSTLMTMLAMPLGLPSWWARGSWDLVGSIVALGPWLAISCVAALVLLMVELVRGRPRDAWGRMVPRGRTSVALAASTAGLVVLTPVLVVCGFLFFLASAYVCGTSTTTCW